MNEEEFEWVEEEVSLAEFANRFLGVTDLTTPSTYDVDDVYVQSYDVETSEEVYSKMSAFVVKDGVDHHYVLGNLKGSSNHRVLYNDHWVKLKDHPNAVRVDEPLHIVDMTVDDTHCYVANGQINHNTTPGGVALPYHASVRVRLTGGSKVKDTSGNVIGAHVRAECIKNKVNRPFQKCEFDIIFGKGISEHEYLFDHVREWCQKNGPAKVQNLEISLEGTSSWKTLSVNDSTSGEVLLEKKFHKADFKDIMNDSQCKPFVDGLFDEVLKFKRSSSNETFVDEKELVA